MKLKYIGRNNIHARFVTTEKAPNSNPLDNGGHVGTDVSSMA